jgi:adenylosuccinate lyase
MQSGISCIDTRYYNDVKSLVSICDEFAYYRNRILVELKYFTKLTGISISYNPMQDFTIKDFHIIMNKEHIIRHDVKAIEYFIKELPEIRATGKGHLIHVGLTSQDACSLGFILCFRDTNKLILEHIKNLTATLNNQLITPECCNIYMMGITHGQPATPTLFSKEMLIYHSRITNISSQIENSLVKDGLTVKFGGATGEFNAMKFVSPHIDWVLWCDEFVNEFSTTDARIVRTKYTNQCDNYDSITKVLYQWKMFLHILEHLRGNIWLYIHREYLVQRAIATEIGSSTMPNKVNPIDIENAKTAIEMAKRMIDGICDVLSETSYQRDVSDSSALRNISSIAGYILIAIKKVSTGISRLSPNENKIRQELDEHPEVILEGVQTYLKYHCGMGDAYEKMKDISRGKNGITLQDIYNVVDKLDILEEHKIKIKTLTPNTYNGLFSH